MIRLIRYISVVIFQKSQPTRNGVEHTILTPPLGILVLKAYLQPSIKDFKIENERSGKSYYLNKYVFYVQGSVGMFLHKSAELIIGKMM